MIIFENILENRGQTKLFKYITSYPFAQILDEETQNPELIQKAVSGMKQLNEADLLMLLGLINRLLASNNKSEGT